MTIMVHPARLEIDRICSMMTAAGIGERIIDRVRRLNPNPYEGCALRGFHRHNEREIAARWRYGLIPRKEFVAEFGREAFDKLKQPDIVRIGRRRFVTREAIRGRSWEHP